MVPHHPPDSCVHIGEQKNPPVGHCPGARVTDSHGAGDLIAGGSRRRTWRYFILAGCLGCFSFLLRRAVAGLGDAGIPWPAGCAVAIPGAGGSLRLPPAPLHRRASWSDRSCLCWEFLAFPAGTGSRDACGWGLAESVLLPGNPLRAGGGKDPSPHCRGVQGGLAGVRLPSHTPLVLDGALWSGAGGRHRTPYECGVTCHPGGTKPRWVRGGRAGVLGGPALPGGSHFSLLPL